MNDLNYYMHNCPKANVTAKNYTHQLESWFSKQWNHGVIEIAKLDR